MKSKFNSFFQKFKEETEQGWENKIYNPNPNDTHTNVNPDGNITHIGDNFK